ncbi:MAG: SLC13 family permease [Anaerolineales bacterium]
MTSEIILTLSILGVVMLLFITEWLRADLVALLTLSVLALTGLVKPDEALSGFSSPAVITVWAVFILSAGLARTGVASWMGRQVLRLGGGGEKRMLFVVMAVAAVLSGFMNNVGVTALMLPVVLDICRRTNRPPSLMLIPLAFSASLGGMMTMIGTPANILVSDILDKAGFNALGLFDFLPFGVIVTFTGIIYLMTVGQKLLPQRDVTKEFHENGRDKLDTFSIEERLFVITLPEKTHLDGLTLGQSRFGSVLGLNVIGVMRKGHTNLGPNPETVLRGGDRLLVTGRADQLLAWKKTPQFQLLSNHSSPEHLTSEDVQLVEARLSPNSSILGKNLEQLHFRQQYGGIVLALCRNSGPIHYALESVILQPDDKLLMMVHKGQIAALNNEKDLILSETNACQYQLEDALRLIKIPAGSHLANKTIAEIHLGDAYRMGVFGIMRDGKTILMPVANETILTGDQLIVKIRPESMAILDSLHTLEIDTAAHPSYEDMESDTVGLLDVVISPQSSLPGKTLREAHFREKYGLSVLAIWRAGTTKRSGLRDLRLQFGDALLVFGPRERLNLMASELDFIPLTEKVQTPPRLKKAPIAAVLMVTVVITVGLGWIPVSLATVIGGALMVLSGGLKMDEAYRSIQWNAVFLIAGMIPLGIAMQTSGTAEYLALALVARLEPFGTYIMVGGFFLLGVLTSQVMPNAVVTVLLTPVAISTANDLGVSAYSLAMVVAIAASSSFLTPVGHAANILIMGPGGYKFSDYIKVGLPLVLVTLLLIIFVLPIFWPL